MTKLIVQVPAYNEALHIGEVLQSIPRAMPGNIEVEVLVIDDGSTDQTGALAISFGADYIRAHGNNRGLARAFETGINECLARGADIIVNVDADMQYDPSQIGLLVAPIINGEADITIGDRQIWKSESFGIIKRLTQVFGSRVVSTLAGQTVSDAVSGFRAYSRDAAFDLNILSDFSYTTETIIQAGALRRRIMSVPVTRRDDTRPSRLARSAFKFVLRQAITIIRARIMYRPLRTFFSIGALFLIAGMIPIIRFGFFYITGFGDGHIQSLILGAVFLIISFLTFALGIIADLVGFNRKLLERQLRISKRLLYDKGE